MAETNKFDRAIDKLKGLDRGLTYNVPDDVNSRARKIAISAQEHVILQDAIAHGILLEGIESRWETFIPGFSRIKIVSEAPYSGYVEYGTGMFAEPLSPQYKAPDFSHALVHAIIQWMTVKPSFTLRPTFHRALQISTKISETGTEAKPFMRPAWRQGYLRLRRDVHSSVSREVRRASREV